MRRIFAILFALFTAFPALAGPFVFPSIDGGDLDLDDWAGRPVLVVNTASRCGFTPQYEGLQALYDTYRDRGLVVLAVPSNDFRQELSTEEEVKEFCELTYGIDIPMTEITHVRGAEAHPLFQWLKSDYGFEPSWNFNKVLLGGDGKVIDTWGSMTKPTSRSITKAVEGALQG